MEQSLRLSFLDAFRYTYNVTNSFWSALGDWFCGRTISVSEAQNYIRDQNASSLTRKLDIFVRNVAHAEPNAGLDQVSDITEEAASNDEEILRLQTQVRQLQRQLALTNNSEKDREISRLQQRVLSVGQHAAQNIRSLESQVSRLRRDASTVEEKNRLISQLESQVRQLQQTGSNVDDNNRVIRRLENQIRELEQRLTSQVAGNTGDHVRALVNRLRAERDEQRSQVARLTQELGRDMNRRLAENEEGLENVGRLNRPNLVIDGYRSLVTTEWLDAKDALDDCDDDIKTVTGINNEDELERCKLRMLSSVLMEAQEIALSLYSTSFNRKLVKALRQPIRNAEDEAYSGPVVTIVPIEEAEQEEAEQEADDRDYTDREMQQLLGGELFRLLKLYLKEHGVDADLDIGVFLSELKEVMREQHPFWNRVIDADGQTALRFENYFKACAIQLWRMVVQSPKLRLVPTPVGTQFDPENYDLYLGESRNVPISGDQYPALYQGDNRQVKAKVITGQN